VARRADEQMDGRPDLVTFRYLGFYIVFCLVCYAFFFSWFSCTTESYYKWQKRYSSVAVAIAVCGIRFVSEGATPPDTVRRSDQIRADIAGQNHRTREPESGAFGAVCRAAGGQQPAASAPHAQTNCKNKKYVSGRCSRCSNGLVV